MNVRGRARAHTSWRVQRKVTDAFTQLALNCANNDENLRTCRRLSIRVLVIATQKHNTVFSLEITTALTIITARAEATSS